MAVVARGKSYGELFSDVFFIQVKISQLYASTIFVRIEFCLFFLSTMYLVRYVSLFSYVNMISLDDCKYKCI